MARAELQRRDAAAAAAATAAPVPANAADKDRDARDGLLIAAGVTAVVLGLLWFVTPVGFGVWLWQRGELAWKGGDYRPLGTLMAWAVLMALLLACWAVAGSLLIGARHRGSCGEMSDALSRIRKDKLGQVGKRG